MQYNAADQLTRWPGMHGDATHAGYTYYNDGSLHEVKNAGGTSSLANYAYTYDGLMERAVYAGGTKTLTNTWDADSNRVRMTLAGGQSNTCEFVYDPTAGIPAVIEEVNGGASSTTTAYYFREPSGSLICRVEDSNTAYYHFDALGSTRLLTDSSGNVTDRYAYDAYGALLSHDRLSASIDQPYQYVGQLGYYTHYQEPDLGLMQLGVRFYDPEVGRFAQIDQVLSIDQSAYVYASANPWAFRDPSGLENREEYYPTRIYIDSSCDEKMKAKLVGYIYYDPEDEKKDEKRLDPKTPESEPIDNVYWFDPESKRWYGARTPNACRVWITCHPKEKKWFRVHWSCGFRGWCAGGVKKIERGDMPPLPDPSKKGGKQ